MQKEKKVSEFVWARPAPTGPSQTGGAELTVMQCENTVSVPGLGYLGPHNNLTEVGLGSVIEYEVTTDPK